MEFMGEARHWRRGTARQIFVLDNGNREVKSERDSEIAKKRVVREQLIKVQMLKVRTH